MAPRYGWQNFGENNEEGFLFDFLLWGITQDIIEQLEDRYADAMREFVNRIREEEPWLLQQLAALHKDVARGAQEKIIESYQMSPYIDKSHPYRFAGDIRFRRYSKGKMLNALRDPGLIKSDSYAIHFVDRGILDNQAKQWRRLNFGAKPKGQRKVEEGKMTMFGQATGVGLALQGKPSAAFAIPQTLAYGFFANQFAGDNFGQAFTPVSPGSHRGDAFYIYVKGFTVLHRKKNSKYGELFKRRMTRGIFGSSFLEEGARYINKEYPPRLEQLILDFYRRAWDEVEPPTPRPGSGGTLVKVEQEVARATGRVRTQNAQTAARNARARAQAASRGYIVVNRYQWDKIRRQLGEL